MRLTANQVKLSKGLGIVSRAISSRTTMPILGNVLLEATGNTLRLAATNREMGLTCWIGAKVEDDGAITVPARLMSEFVNSLPAEQVTMDLAERTQTVLFQCARFKASMKGLPADEFPMLPTIDGQPEDAQRITLPAATLSNMIAGVVVAASDDENRPTLTGVEVTIGEALTMAATDGYRLCWRHKDVDAAMEPVRVIVPHGTLEALGKMLGDADGEVVCVIPANRNQILFGWTGNEKAGYQRAEMSSELIDARFPDYQATVPKSYNVTWKVDTAKLSEALKVAMLFARDNANIVTFEGVPDRDGNGRLVLAATSAELGGTESSLPCDIEGDAIKIAFNGRLLQDALAHVGHPQTTVELTQPTRPGLFYGGNRGDGYAVIMPMSPPKG